jgi:bacterioferritin-associated ferredoxin
MYICICHAVTDTVIRAAVDDGVTSLSDLGFKTGCGTQCGSCVPKAREIIREALKDRDGSTVEVNLRMVPAT